MSEFEKQRRERIERGEDAVEADRDAAQLALTEMVAFFLDHGIESNPLVRLLSELAALSAGSSPSSILAPAATPHRRPDPPAIEGIKGRLAAIMESRQEAGLTRKQAAAWVARHLPSGMRKQLGSVAPATVDSWLVKWGGERAVDLVMSIPGIKKLGAHVIVSEIGIDMSRFPSDAHLISWACICPRNDESAGKRRSNRLRKGGTWLKTTLVQCAWAAVKKKDSYLQAQFYRIKARRGPKKAIMAVVASILTAIYHMLKDGTMYKDLGCNHFNRRSTDQQKTHLIKRLADLGYTVEIKPVVAMA